MFFRKNKSEIKELNKRISVLEKHVLDLTYQNKKLLQSLSGLQRCVDQFLAISESVVSNRSMITDLYKTLTNVLDNIAPKDDRDNDNHLGIIKKDIKKLPN